MGLKQSLVVMATTLAVLALAACSRQPPPAATPTPHLTGPGETLTLPLDSEGAPTAAVPYVQLNIVVTDERTGQRVDTALISVDGHVLAQGCCAVVSIEATAPHTLTVTAEGYQAWQVLLSPRHIQHDTILDAPVRLAPVQPEA